jgi:hypothetical protein
MFPQDYLAAMRQIVSSIAGLALLAVTLQQHEKRG